jgi:NDP-sugar pyrophosphorylase family protein
MIETVVILAGGLATRLYPITKKVPKALLDIDGEPFISHQLRYLFRQGIRRAVICTGHLGHMIKAHLGVSHQGIKIDYCDDGTIPLGTGGAIFKALETIEGPSFIQYGDSYLPIHYSSVSAAFNSTNFAGILTVLKNEGLWDKSNTDYSSGIIIRHSKHNTEKRMAYIDYGLSILSKEALKMGIEIYFKSGTSSQQRRRIDQSSSFSLPIPFDLSDIYSSLSAESLLAGYEVTERFYEIGSFSGLEETKRYLLSIELQCSEFKH